MQKFSIEAVAKQQIERAGQTSAARSATTVFGGHEHALRQTVVGLSAGAILAEHENPGEATLYVIMGRITLNADGETWDGRSGDMIVVPPQRHSVVAEEESAILLTVVPRNRSATDR